MDQAPTFAQMIDWLDGRIPLTADQLATADPAERRWLQSFQQLSQQITLATPPAAVRQNLRQQFAAFAQTRQQPGFFQRLVAALSFDSFTQAAPAGVRAANLPSGTRQLVYSTHTADIALNTQQQDEMIQLWGQIFLLQPATDPNLSVQLWRDQQEIGLTLANDLGEFTFSGLIPGTFEIVISSDTFEIIIPLTM